MKQLLNKLNMKTILLITSLASISLLKVMVFPDMNLLIIMGFLVIMDYCTGILKSVLNDTPRTSSRLKKKIKDVSTYLIVIVCGIVTTAVADIVNMPIPRPYANFFMSAVLIAIIHTELVSNLENAKAISPKSLVTTYIIDPMLNLFTFNLSYYKNIINSFKQMQHDNAKK